MHPRKIFGYVLTATVFLIIGMFFGVWITFIRLGAGRLFCFPVENQMVCLRYYETVPAPTYNSIPG